jgi:hypothetical protein
MRTDTRLTEVQVPEAPETPPRYDRFLMVGLAVVAVWLAVGAMSLFSPDLITGSEHEHLPLVAMTVWPWAAFATAFLVMTGAMGHGSSDGRWRGLALVIAAIWAVVAVASIFTPTIVTGADPTEVPIAGLLAPVAAMIGTAFACLLVTGASKS